jgi:hypothetical protein
LENSFIVLIKVSERFRFYKSIKILNERRIKMTTEAKIQLTSTELGTLWMTYLSKSAKLLILEVFKDKTIDAEAKNILTSYISEGQNVKTGIVNIFNNETAVIPLAFAEQDILRMAPPLFDDIFNVMFLRQMMKLNLGHTAVDVCMSYMKEVQEVFKLNEDISYKHYVMSTEYLLGKGVLARPPFVTMPKQVEFIEDKSYMSGIGLLTLNVH